MRFVLGLFVLAALVVLYFWAALSWSYSNGERAGWVQKLSKKGWVCKTWEGELALISLPGSAPEKFYFTITDDAVAAQVMQVMGKRAIGQPSARVESARVMGIIGTTLQRRVQARLRYAAEAVIGHDGDVIADRIFCYRCIFCVCDPCAQGCHGERQRCRKRDIFCQFFQGNFLWVGLF